MILKVKSLIHEKALLNRKAEALIEQIKRRSENLILTKQLMCAESVLVVLNQGLGGGLPPEMAVRLASGLPEGLGGSGCVCGALSGGVLSIGLFLGREGPGLRNGKQVMNSAKVLRDQFKDCFDATCCRVLTKGLKRGSKDHFQQCSIRAGFSAEMSARIILQKKPELIPQADHSYLGQQDSSFAAVLKKIANTIQS